MSDLTRQQQEICNRMINEWTVGSYNQFVHFTVLGIQPEAALQIVVDAMIMSSASLLATTSEGKTTDQEIMSHLIARIEHLSANHNRVYGEVQETGEMKILGGLQ